MRNRAQSNLLVLIASCFIFILSPVNANNSIDWYERILSASKDTILSDSAKAIRISELTFTHFYYYRSIGSDSINLFLNKVLPLTENLPTDDAKIHIYGTALLMAEYTDRLDEMIGKAQYYTQKGRDPQARYLGWIRLGQVNMHNILALKCFLNAYDEVKFTGDNEAKSMACRYVSIYYRGQQDYRNSLKYARQSYEFALESEDTRTLVNSWLELAYIYYETPEKIYWDNAVEAYGEVDRIYKEQILKEEPDSDKHYMDVIHYMIALVNMGLFQYDLENYNIATKYLNDALEMATEARIAETISFCNKQLGLIYQKKAQYWRALGYYKKAEEALKNLRSDESNYLEYEILLAKAGVYKLLYAYSQSSACYREGIEKYRKVFDAEILQENQIMAMQYEAARREEELNYMETIIDYTRRQRYFRVGIIVLQLIGIVLVTRIFLYKIKLAGQHEQDIRDKAEMWQLEHEKAKLATRIRMEESEALKQRLDESNRLLTISNNTLAKLQSFFSAHSQLNQYKSQLELIILQQNRMQDEFKSGIKDVPVDFNVHLQKHAENKLTSLDLKYCRLIYLGMATREIAEMLFVDPNTVKVTKYRLKQKFNLGKENDLNDFIRNIGERAEVKNEIENIIVETNTGTVS